MAKRPWAAGMAISIMITTGSGCNSYFDIPPAKRGPRLRGEPVNNLITVLYKKNGDRFDATVQDTPYRLFTLPGDSSASVRLDAFQAEYFDMNNKSLPSLYLAKRTIPAPVVVPAATSTTSVSVPMELPLASPELQAYGEAVVRDRQKFGGFSDTISAAVTLFGTDDRGSALEVRFNVPIIFKLQSAEEK